MRTIGLSRVTVKATSLSTWATSSMTTRSTLPADMITTSG